MLRSLRTMVLGAAVAATSLSPIMAQAHDSRYRGYHDEPRFERVDDRPRGRRQRGCYDRYDNFVPDCDRRGRKIRRGNDDLGAAIAIGAIGLITGAVVLNSINKQNNVRTRPEYYPAAPQRVAPQRVIPRRSVDEPRVITYDDIQTGSVDGATQPWSTAWYRYCENRYRSFNASTGTYRGYDGQDHFCQAR